jgi:hypothetical protein
VIVSEFTEAEILREERLDAEFARLTANTCAACGNKVDVSGRCYRCGSVKGAKRGTIAPFDWAVALGEKSKVADPLPQSIVADVRASTVSAGVASSLAGRGSVEPAIIHRAKPKAARKKTGTDEGGLF